MKNVIHVNNLISILCCLFIFSELGQQAAAAAKLIYDKFTKGDEIRNIYIKLGKEKKEEYMVFFFFFTIFIVD